MFNGFLTAAFDIAGGFGGIAALQFISLKILSLPAKTF